MKMENCHMLPSRYFLDRLLQPIRTLGFATLNTTLCYRENPSLTVAFGGFFAFGQLELFGLRAILL